MTDLEKRKIHLELTRVMAAKMDLEIRIEEMKHEIQRLSEHVLVQEKKEKELKQKLGE